MPAATSDRIEKTIVLKAPRARVWRAIGNAEEFGRWFGVRFDGPFKSGTTLHGVIVPTTVDPEVAKLQEPFAGTPFDVQVERVEPPRLLSFRWSPGPVEPGVDHPKEPMTLVVFALEEEAEGTRLTITESGFDSIPLERRVKAFTSNEQGWSDQLRLIEKYLSHAA
jgi:uncharacterized protein YndB with AHSA1/START domain